MALERLITILRDDARQKSQAWQSPKGDESPEDGNNSERRKGFQPRSEVPRACPRQREWRR